jgi:hypothetical protein
LVIGAILWLIHNTWVSGNANGAPGSTAWPTVLNNYIEFTGVQLEKGTIATPFEFRPYDQELRICQRYYVALGGDANYQKFGVGYANLTTNGFVIVPLQTKMRAVPSFGSSGSFVLWYSNTSAAVTSITADALTTETQSLYVTSSGLTNGIPVFLQTNNNLTARLIFSADL